MLDGNQKVRLIGVDTPETSDPRKPVEHFGREACERGYPLCSLCDPPKIKKN